MIAKDLIDYGIPLLKREDKVSKALDLMEADAIVKAWMPPTMYESYVAVKRTEIALAKDLSDEELCERYAGVY